MASALAAGAHVNVLQKTLSHGLKALFGQKFSARRIDNQRAEAMVKCAALLAVTGGLLD